MFKKLRIKFIAITMAMVAVVMALSFTAVCVIEYQRSYSVVQTALSDAVEQAISDEKRASQNQGIGQKPFRFGAPGSRLGGAGSQGANGSELDEADGAQGLADEASGRAVEQDAVPDSGSASDVDSGLNSDLDSFIDSNPDSDFVSDSDSDSRAIAPPFIGMREGQSRQSSSLIPVAVYAAGSNGQTHVVPQVTTASISEDVLSEALELAAEAEDGIGTFATLGLHYEKVTADERSFFVFADTSYTDGWKTLALVLGAVGIATLVVFLVVSLFYSRWALRPVREAWDSQKQFVADASHDLKTPLTVILANAAILLKHPERTIASESQWIESTQVEAENMQGLVNEMLELAQVEAGESVAVEKDRLDFSDLVDGETLLFDSVALERDCSFSCEVEAGLFVEGNEAQVKKMVSTIVENAFKYVDAGGTVDIRLRASGKIATLSIRNSGAHIAEADLPHIFDRFYRTDKARTSGEGGFGLGLAIAREIARQHGGDITCASDPAAGTTFTISLPLA